jgi:phosphatidylinositol alpha-mannosyltransferase
MATSVHATTEAAVGKSSGGQESGIETLPPPPAGRHRVALVSEYYYPHHGGICEHVHFLARELRRRGHHADIVTSAIGDTSSEDGVIRIGRSVPTYSNGSLARFSVGFGLRRRLREVLKRGGYDVVHVHSPLTPLLPMLAISAATCPVVGTFHTYFHGSVAYRLMRPIFQRYLDRLDAVIAVSETAKTAHARYFDADWHIIPNGVDLTCFRPGVPRPDALSVAADHVLFLGRLDPRNGLATLIAAFRQLRRLRKTNGEVRPVRLVVVGDGPLRGHYERMAAGDPDIVFVGGVLDGREGYYAHSDVYACPTTKASFGITLLEAMAASSPIVCSDIVGFRDVVRSDVEAVMTPCGDVGALAQALERVMRDPLLAGRLAAAGRERVVQFGWPVVTEQVLAVYDRVTSSVPRRALRG